MIAEHASHPADGLPEAPAWPFWRDPDGLRLVGRCPHCRGLHEHVLCADPSRLGHCHGRAELYRLVVRVEPLPDDIAFVLTTEVPPDIVNLRRLIAGPTLSSATAVAKLGENAARFDGQRGRLTPRDRQRFHVACAAIVRAGVLDERIAIRVEDGGGEVNEVARAEVAAFIRQQAGPTMRLRLVAALDVARRMIEAGEIL